MSYEFFKVPLNGLDLFIFLMHILIFKQVHVIYAYISYCFVFWSQWFMQSLNTNYMLPSIVDFWFLDAQFL